MESLGEHGEGEAVQRVGGGIQRNRPGGDKVVAEEGKAGELLAGLTDE